MFSKYLEKWRNLSSPAKWAGRGAAFLAAYSLIGFLLFPFVAHKVLLSQLPEVLKRPVSIEDVDFNPYTLDFRIEGLRTAKKQGQGDLLSFKRFSVNLDSFSIFRLTLVISKVSFDDLYLDVSLYKGGTSVSDLVPQAQEEAQKEQEASLFPVVVENFSFVNGTIKVFDKPKNKQHVVSDINISVPFTSTLTSHTKDFVQPSLSAVINGTPLVMKGKTLPFDSSLRTQFDFVLQKAELKDYRVYLPLPEEVQIKSGTLSSSIALVFERTEDVLPKIKFAGEARVENFDLIHTGQGSLINFKDFELKFDDLEILKRIVRVKSARILDPYIKMTLKRDGMPELMDFLTPVGTETADAEAKTVSETKEKPAASTANVTSFNSTVVNATAVATAGTNATGENATIVEGGKAPVVETRKVEPAQADKDEESESPVFLATVENFELVGGVVDFKDNAFGKGHEKKIGPINVSGRNITTARDRYGDYSVEIGKSGAEHISSRGRVSLTPFDLEGSFSVGNMSIPVYSGYYEDFLPLDISSGIFGVSGSFRLTPPAEGLNATTRVSDLDVDLKKLRLERSGKVSPVLGVEVLSVSNGTVDLGKRMVAVGSVGLDGGLIRLARDKEGIDLVRLLDEMKAGEKKSEEAESESETVEQEPEEKPGWKVDVDKIAMKGSRFELIDRAATKKTVIELGDINMEADDFSLGSPEDMFLDISGLVNERGRFSLNGKARMEPLSAQGTVRLRKIRLRDFNGYFPPQMEMDIARGHVDVNGEWDFNAAEKPVAGYRGKVQLKDLLVRDSSNDKEFFTLYELAVRDIDFKSEPLGSTVGLVDIIKPEVNLIREQDGTINLSRMLTGKRAAPVNATAIEEKAESVAVKAGETAPAQPDLPPDANATLASDSEEGTDASFMLDKVRLSNGTVVFRDQVVKPDFVMDITDMKADITKLGLPYGNRTDIVFNATVDDQSPLMLTGKLLPSGEEMKTGMTLNLNNLDMTQLSPYTLKYIAYPVSTGMLNADVKLNLEGTEIAVGNLLDIYQFDVGKKVPNPEAANVPIGLGLALLKDSAGNIRLDIPVEGDLSDPEFRLGAVIGRAIVNLLIKAVTSPFALIGSIFGGGEDINVLAFEPGTEKPGKDAIGKIETIAKAMKERPGLNLEISGFSAAQQDSPALEELTFRRKIAMVKFLELEGDENAPESVDEVNITAEEYPEYLEEVYKDEPFEKPRNVIGLVKTLPVPEMEKAVREHIEITPTDLSQLARKRAEKVRDILISEKGVEAERIFLKDSMQVKAQSAGPRVELGLK